MSDRILAILIVAGLLLHLVIADQLSKRLEIERNNKIESVLGVRSVKDIKERDKSRSLAGIFLLYKENGKITYGEKRETLEFENITYKNITKDKRLIANADYTEINGVKHNPNEILDKNADEFNFYVLEYEPKSNDRVMVIYDSDKNEVTVTPALYNLGEAVRRYYNQMYYPKFERINMVLMCVAAVEIVVVLILLGCRERLKEIENRTIEAKAK